MPYVEINGKHYDHSFNGQVTRFIEEVSSRLASEDKPFWIKLDTDPHQFDVVLISSSTQIRAGFDENQPNAPDFNFINSLN